jgi:ATP-dependent Clp protease ATP-binding subunit ClpA
MGELRMRDSGSSGDKVFGRFSEPAHRLLDLAREEAERCGHRYLGPEHVLLGMLAEGQNGAAGALRAAGADLTAARAALGVDLDRLRDGVAAELGGIRR